MNDHSAVVIYSSGMGYRTPPMGQVGMFSFVNNSARGKKTEPVFIGIFKGDKKKLVLMSSKGAELIVKVSQIPVLSAIGTVGVRVMRFQEKNDSVASIFVK